MNDSLPVEQLADGEGIVIAGKPSQYLNLIEALECTVARAYLIQTVMNLDYDDQVAYFDAQDAWLLGAVGSKIVLDMDSPFGIITYMQVIDSPETVYNFLEALEPYIIGLGFDLTNEEDTKRFAQELSVKYPNHFEFTG